MTTTEKATIAPGHPAASPELAHQDSGDEKLSIASADRVEAGSLTSWEGVHFTPQDVRHSSSSRRVARSDTSSGDARVPQS
jgi:hypothetical protein